MIVIINISFEFTKEDYINFQKYYYTRPPGVFNILGWIVLYFLISFFFDDFSQKITFFIVALPTFCLIFWLKIQLRFRTLKKNTRGPFGPAVIIISEEGIKTKNKYTEVLRSWSVIHKLVETRYYFYFFINKSTAIVIPKRALNFTQEEEIKQKVAEYMHKHAEGA